jgi:RimJ/RimL family protein N-acetyltransferase
MSRSFSRNAIARLRDQRVSLTIRAALENVRSRAIPQRLGFREEGVLREAERVGDGYLDIVVYSMLGTEWRSSADAADRAG